MAEPFTRLHEQGRPAARRERRHGPDRPGPLPQGHRQGRPRRRAVPRLAVRGGRLAQGAALRPRPAGDGRPRGSCSSATTSAAGSSREHAPWALTAWGIRAILSTSFADIFRNNSLKNGVLPIVVDAATHARLFALLAEDPDAELTDRPRRAGRPAPGRLDDRLRHRPVRQADDPRGHGRARLPPVEGARAQRVGGRPPAADRFARRSELTDPHSVPGRSDRGSEPGGGETQRIWRGVHRGATDARPGSRGTASEGGSGGPRRRRGSGGRDELAGWPGQSAGHLRISGCAVWRRHRRRFDQSATPGSTTDTGRWPWRQAPTHVHPAGRHPPSASAAHETACATIGA